MIEAPTTPAEVDVVIITWNDGELLRAAIDSVLTTTGPEVRIWVVDNGSEPAAAVPSSSRISLVRNNTNAGVARARNQGIRLGSAPVVCLLDSDAQLTDSALADLVDHLDDRIWCVGPVFDGQLAIDSGGRAPTFGTKARRATGRQSNYEAGGAGLGGLRNVDFVIGACQVFTRRAWEVVGGIDERYFYGPEDVDFCLRIRDSGGKVAQVPMAVVIHPPRRSHRRLFTRRGAQHAGAVAHSLWRHRHFRSRHPIEELTS